MKYSNYFYWNVGRKVNLLKDKCSNPIKNISDFYAYTFGFSEKFSRNNIFIMKNFYLCFPIYFDRFNELSWDHFKLLIKIKNSKVRNFYLWISLFCKSSVNELATIIDNSLYYRI